LFEYSSFHSLKLNLVGGHESNGPAGRFELFLGAASVDAAAAAGFLAAGFLAAAFLGVLDDEAAVADY
jgi:hypothetical protein